MIIRTFHFITFSVQRYNHIIFPTRRYLFIIPDLIYQRTNVFYHLSTPYLKHSDGSFVVKPNSYFSSHSVLPRRTIYSFWYFISPRCMLPIMAQLIVSHFCTMLSGLSAFARILARVLWCFFLFVIFLKSSTFHCETVLVFNILLS